MQIQSLGSQAKNTYAVKSSPEQVSLSALFSGTGVDSVHVLKELQCINAAQSVRFGAKTFAYAPELNIVADLQRRAKEQPNQATLTIAGDFEADPTMPKVLTNRTLYQNSLRVARALKEQYGIKPGDRVATIETNTPEFFELFYASLMIGATIVPINIMPLADKNKAKAKAKLAHMVRLSNAKALFIGKTIESNKDLKPLSRLRAFQPMLVPHRRAYLRHLFKAASLMPRIVPGQMAKTFRTVVDDCSLYLNNLPKGLKIVTSKDSNHFNKLLTAEPLDEKDIITNPDPKSVALMLYTSGSSSLPKCVPISHQALVHNTESLKTYATEITEKDKQLVILPMFHIFGLSAFLACQSKGAKGVVVPFPADGAQNPKKLLDAIQEEGVTIMPTVPLILERMFRLHGTEKDQVDVAEKLKNVRLLMSGGQKLPKKVHETMKKLLPTATSWEGYGMTEAGILTINKTGEYGHVGKKISDHIELKLVDMNSHGVGEIWAQTPSCGEGFVDLPAKEIAESFREDGWYATGDLGQYDEQGNLKIVGRKKETIKRGGEFIALEDFDSAQKENLVRNGKSLIKDVMSFSYVPPGTDEDKVMSIVLLDEAAYQETEATLKALLNDAATANKMERRYAPDYILPLAKKEYPNGFINKEMDKRQYNECRAYLKQMQEKKVIEFGPKELKVKDAAKL